MKIWQRFGSYACHLLFYYALILSVGALTFLAMPYHTIQTDAKAQNELLGSSLSRELVYQDKEKSEKKDEAEKKRSAMPLLWTLVDYTYLTAAPHGIALPLPILQACSRTVYDSVRMTTIPLGRMAPPQTYCL